MTVHDDSLLATPHDDSRNLVIVRFVTRSRQGLKITHGRAGAHALQQFANERPIETNFEVCVTKSLALEAKRKSGKFAVPRHHRPHLSNRSAEVHSLPSGSGLDLHESSAAPLPRWKRELFDDCLSGVRKCEAAVP